MLAQGSPPPAIRGKAEAAVLAGAKIT
jgi:hypothetical protein